MEFRELTASEITSAALQELGLRGWDVWRQNNLAVRGRRFIGREGQSDIIGFSKHTGQFMACEVKKNGDTLKGDQELFLGAVMKSGGVAIIAMDDGKGGVKLVDYDPNM